jgi:biotin carboxyl carrier protein
MIQATINGKTVFDVEKDLLNNRPFEWDILPIGKDSFHIIKENISYTATLLAINKEEKTMLLRINNNEYEIAIKDKYDLLLQKMGIAGAGKAKINKFKAPMPGLIKEIMAQIGASVAKGDLLLILEAMKMENSLKSPTDGIVKNIAISKGNTVEKGQVLIEFE